eukprot:GEMP01117527.1.p1 GENE.GEMP01117527.1~~GEMP01117527.1.p1  ORF type:complete len:118 (+),score=5.91 GEMP01117527.1:101-454(+)
MILSSILGWLICNPCIASGALLITDMSMEVQEANTLNVSEDCPSRMESCLSLEDFLKHPFSFLLLFELGRQNGYKDKIIRGIDLWRTNWWRTSGRCPRIFYFKALSLLTCRSTTYRN